jgi:hypothetical protein
MSTEAFKIWKMYKNLKFESWAKKLKDEVGKIGLAYIWHSQQKNNINM